MGLKLIDRKITTRTDFKWFPIYLEKARICQKEFGITAYCDNGKEIDIPVGILSSLIIGPGTSITHGAISVCADCNCVISWVGENGLIYYATGAHPISNNKNLMQQIKMRANKRIDVVRKMFEKREIGISPKDITLDNMFGLEGTCMKKVYQDSGEKYGVSWHGRKYNKNNFCASDDINKAVSSANSILYSVCFSVIYSLGFIPSVGFIHNGTMIDLVLDISDIYKKSISIDSAFNSVSISGGFNSENLKSIITKNMEEKIPFRKISKDIYEIFWDKDVGEDL